MPVTLRWYFFCKLRLCTMDKRDRDMSSWTRYSDLTIKLCQTMGRWFTQVRTMTEKIIFEGSKAVGVQCMENGKPTQFRASKEVILSGGAINSPQLLMLSGVGECARKFSNFYRKMMADKIPFLLSGNADDLKELDVPVVQHLPGVGENLQDHLEVYVQNKCKKVCVLGNVCVAFCLRITCKLMRPSSFKSSQLLWNDRLYCLFHGGGR